jgi:hypothetical protein
MIPLGMFGFVLFAGPFVAEREGLGVVMMLGAGMIVAAFVGAAMGAPLWIEV